MNKCRIDFRLVIVRIVTAIKWNFRCLIFIRITIRNAQRVLMNSNQFEMVVVRSTTNAQVQSNHLIQFKLNLCSQPKCARFIYTYSFELDDYYRCQRQFVDSVDVWHAHFNAFSSLSCCWRTRYRQYKCAKAQETIWLPQNTCTFVHK